MKFKLICINYILYLTFDFLHRITLFDSLETIYYKLDSAQNIINQRSDLFLSKSIANLSGLRFI